MLKFTLEHRLECTPQRHWALFWDPDWSRQLVVEGLGFLSCACEEPKEANGKRTRSMRVTPKINVPAAVAKLLGPKLAYTERGALDIESEIWTFDTILSVLADRILMGGTVRIRDEGDGQCTRVTDLWVEAKIFGLGGIVERAAERNLRDGWDESARWINRWVREHPGQGDPSTTP